MQGEEIIKQLKQIKKLIKEEAPQIAMMRIDFLIDDIFYSDLSDFTGLAIAALIACELSVKIAMISEIQPVAMKIHKLKLILNAKSCNHVLIKYHAIGAAIIKARSTSFTKSVDSIFTMLLTEAPSTLRILISFCR